MIELLFLLGFTLHNIEEALWLPKWSKHAKKFHKEVSDNEFRFAIIIVTIIGYLLTFQYLIFANKSQFSRYIFLGFILMMVINTFLPHLAATMVLKKYAPGTITGLLLNVPIGLYLLYNYIQTQHELLMVILCGIALAVIIVPLLNLFFKAGKRLLG